MCQLCRSIYFPLKCILLMFTWGAPLKCQCNLELLLGCHLLLETLMSMNNTLLSQHKVAKQSWLQHYLKNL